MVSLPRAQVQVQSLVGELRPHSHMAQPKEKKRKAGFEPYSVPRKVLCSQRQLYTAGPILGTVGEQKKMGTCGPSLSCQSSELRRDTRTDQRKLITIHAKGEVCGFTGGNDLGSKSEVEGVSRSALAGLLLAGRVMDTRVCPEQRPGGGSSAPWGSEVVSAPAVVVGAS